MLQDATLDLLKFEPFPLLAAAVEARTEAVLSRWQKLVCEKLPTADEMTLAQLRDELPIVFRELAKTLASANGDHFKQLEAVAQNHGQVRYHQSYNIGELIVEYGMLRSILIDEVMTHLGRGLSVAESASLHMGMDTAIRNGVIRFTTFQQQQLKSVVDAQIKNLSYLSHDLRGGLNGVLLMVEVLKRELASEPKFSESIHDLDSMRQSILETVGTMDRFLHAERFRQGKVQPHNTSIELAGFVDELIQTFRHQAEAKRLKLIAAVSAVSTAFADKELLMLILQNFVSNALKYTAKGSVEVKAEQAANGKISIRVTDTGPGIGTERMDHLFMPFVRGETHGQEGVGLGLSIAKQAADVIGAKISVESKVGSGSAFILELP